MDGYIFLLDKIAKKIPNKQDANYIKKNIKKIAKELLHFSSVFTKIIDIASSDNSFRNKQNKINNLRYANKNKLFTHDESSKILNTLEFNKIGGATKNDLNIEALREIHENVDKNVTFCFTNIGLIATKLFTNFPKYGLLTISKFFSDLSNMYNFDWHSFNDFTSKLDWVYIYLFILASIPIAGVFFDMIIIVRAIKQERIFLAILTFITTCISLFTLHLVDLGMIIKVLYFLDVLSYTNTNNIKKIPTEGDPEVFYDSFEQDVEVPSDTKLDSLKKAYSEITESNKTSPSIKEKKNNLQKLKEILSTSTQSSTKYNEIQNSSVDDSKLEKFDRSNESIIKTSPRGEIMSEPIDTTKTLNDFIRNI